MAFPGDANIAARLMQDMQRDLGLTPAQAAGVVGNFAHESNGFRTLQEINPVVPGSRGGFGFGQWTGPRRRNFEQFARENDLDPNSYEANYGFFLHEVRNDPYERAQFEKVRQAETAEEAAQIVSENYLRPGVPHLNSRIRAAGLALELPQSTALDAIDQASPRDGVTSVASYGPEPGQIPLSQLPLPRPDPRNGPPVSLADALQQRGFEAQPQFANDGLFGPSTNLPPAQIRPTAAEGLDYLIARRDGTLPAPLSRRNELAANDVRLPPSVPQSMFDATFQRVSDAERMARDRLTQPQIRVASSPDIPMPRPRPDNAPANRTGTIQLSPELAAFYQKVIQQGVMDDVRARRNAARAGDAARTSQGQAPVRSWPSNTDMPRPSVSQPDPAPAILRRNEEKAERLMQPPVSTRTANTRVAPTQQTAGMVRMPDDAFERISQEMRVASQADGLGSYPTSMALDRFTESRTPVSRRNQLRAEALMETPIPQSTPAPTIAPPGLRNDPLGHITPMSPIAPIPAPPFQRAPIPAPPYQRAPVPASPIQRATTTKRAPLVGPNTGPVKSTVAAGPSPWGSQSTGGSSGSKVRLNSGSTANTGTYQGTNGYRYRVNNDGSVTNLDTGITR